MESRLFKLTGIVMLVTMTMHASSAQRLLSEKPYKPPRCDSPSCDIDLQRSIRNTYGDLFLSQEEFRNLTATFNAVRTDSLKLANRLTSSYWIRHDGDSCCATGIFYRIRHFKTDIYGIGRQIVHLTMGSPKVFQHIPFARCVPNSNSFCTGMCVIEQTFLKLLVYDSGSSSGVTFAWFSVPSYCSCKNVWG